MSYYLQSGIRILIAATICHGVYAQGTDVKGSARATPGDYQAHVQAGAVTIAADFSGHSISSPQSVLATEDFVVVEVAFFGPPAPPLKLSYADFSLRLNGKKNPLPAQPFELVFSSLKDPEWEPPIPPESKSKTSFGGSGKGDPGSTPPPVHVPIAIERGWEQRVLRAALPGGERALPAAGMIFFKYRGKPENIDSIELIYAGPAGKATLTLR